MVALDRADVGKGFADVADLHWHGIGYRLAAGLMLKKLDDAHQIFASTVANIVERMRAGAAASLGLAIVHGRAVQAGDDTAHDVVNVSEIASHFATVE